MFSTTFCALACAGAPDEAKAPPSLTASFCMSWMMRAQRFGIEGKGRLGRSGGRRGRAAGAGVHVGLAARPDFGLDPVDRLARGEKEGVEIGPAPGEIGDLLGRAHLADELARGRVDP